MVKSVLVRFDEDTGDCVVMEPQEVITQDFSTKAEVKIPKGARKITITNPLDMAVYNNTDGLISEVRKEGYDKGFEFGQNEVWRNVGDLLFDPDYGTDFMIFGGWNCQSDIFKDTYGHVFEVMQKWRGQPKRLDIVKVAFLGEEKEAIITRVDGNQVDLMFRGGKTTRRNISGVTRTGKTLEYGLLKWMKGEE